MTHPQKRLTGGLCIYLNGVEDFYFRYGLISAISAKSASKLLFIVCLGGIWLGASHWRGLCLVEL